MLTKGSARPVRGTLPYCVIIFPSLCVLSAAQAFQQKLLFASQNGVSPFS